ERVDLDGFAATWCHDPVAYLSVHPGELIAGGALTQEPVLRIRADAEERAGVADHVHVPIEGVEEPQRGIGGVIERLFVSFREQIRDQAVANVLRERPEQVARLQMLHTPRR